MKENVLGILMYLFVNHMDSSTSDSVNLVSDQLVDELTENGFTKKAIHTALSWLTRCQELSESSMVAAPASLQSLRVLSTEERLVFNIECQEFIADLIGNHIIPQPALEIALQLVLELNSDTIDINLIKWVMLITLNNLPEHEEALKRIEFLVIDNINNEDTLH